MRHFGFVCVVIAGLFAAGCASVSGPAQKFPYPEVTEQEKVTYMFVQEAAEGSLVPEGDGSYRLTLREVIPYTVYFSDRPYTNAGNTPMKEFLDRFCWDPENPPNAAVVLREADASEDILVVQLLSPEYNAAKAILSYKLRPLKDYRGKGLAYYHAGRDESIPQSFGTVSLFIDDCPDRWGDCWAVPRCYSATCSGKRHGSMSYGTCWSWTKGCHPCHDRDTYRRQCKETYNPGNSKIVGCNCEDWGWSFRDPFSHDEIGD